MSIQEERQNFINRFGPEQLEKYHGAELLKLIAAPKQTATDDLKLLFGNDFAPGFSSMYQALEEETNSLGGMNGTMTSTREIFYSAKEKCWKHYKKSISSDEAIQEAEQMRKHLLTAADLLKRNDFNSFYNYTNENKQFFSKGFIHKYLHICFPQWIILDWHKSGYDADDFYRQKLHIKSSDLYALENYFHQQAPQQDLSGIKEKLEKQFGVYIPQDKTPSPNTMNNMFPNNFPLNQILFGPPGTGKTYHTVTKAVEIIDGQVSEDYALAKQRFDELKQEGKIKFITFHQNYSYEDFMVGIRPVLNGTNIAYELHEGPFKQIADKARKDSASNYVLIIDEINRGNISKIFGELITLIEKDKRAGNKHAISMPLMYHKNGDEEFSVPNNLYIIGTMNTADKSIALVDIALRRRFIFEEMMPNPALLEKIEGFDLPRWFSWLNTKITAELDRDHQIGHSYFIGLKSTAELQQVFYQCILPLLKEYFYGSPDKLKEIIPAIELDKALEGVELAQVLSKVLQ